MGFNQRQLCPSPREHCAIPGNAFYYHNLEDATGIYLSDRPGMLLNILHCGGQPPPQRITQPQISTVPRSRTLIYTQEKCVPIYQKMLRHQTFVTTLFVEANAQMPMTEERMNELWSTHTRMLDGNVHACTAAYSTQQRG